MKYRKVLMDFSGVKKVEKSAEFQFDGHSYMCCVSVNPNNGNVLFSLFLDRKPVVINRVVVVGELMIDGFGAYDFSDIMNGDFAFLPSSGNTQIGNPACCEDLGNSLFLYYITGDDV